MTTTRAKTTKNPPEHFITEKTSHTSNNTNKNLIVFSDGGARGNPGPAAIAFIIQTETERILLSDTKYIGTATNNQAEYKAILSALEAAATLKPQNLTCHLDSELVTKQLQGKYKVKNPELKQLWQSVQKAKEQFTHIQFINVPRTNKTIQKADTLLNQTLDKQTRQPSLNKT